MNDQPTQAETKPNVGKPSSTELLKAIFDFLAKCFYPVIIIYLIILVKPTLSDIDLKALVSRLESAKAGDYVFTFGQAEDVGATTAPLNNKIAELERTVNVLVNDMSVLQEKSDTQLFSEDVQKQRAEEKKRFEENSRYTVLVFHGSSARQRAERITRVLLAAGYTSSSTETDFSELRKTHPPDSVYITHNKAGALMYTEVAALIADLDTGENLKVQKTSTDLRRGEVQVLVF